MNSGSSTPYGIEREPKQHIRDILPLEKVCPTTGNFCSGVRQEHHANYCPECGTKLETRVADMYIDISMNRYKKDPVIPTEDPDCKPEPRRESDTSRMSIRQFIRVLKEYEKEVFVEDI